MTVASQNKDLKEYIFTDEFLSKNVIGTDYTYRHEIIWPYAAGMFVAHLIAAYGFIFYFFSLQFLPFLIFGYLGNLGITVGAHRYYSHRSFKAKLLFRVLMVLFETASGNFSIFWWVRNHRLHHRYSDTDADPQNPQRGFFFGHVGWMITKKHPYVIELEKRIDMSDLEADPVVMFQKRYYWYLFFLTAVLLPTWIPVYCFGMSLFDAVMCNFLRFIIVVNAFWLVSSAGHLYGTRPYDRNMWPVESWLLSLMTLGEGWHNYHHTFPWDYRAAEDGMPFNLSTTVINFFAAIGQAYDLKTASPEMVEKRILRTGDGTHYSLGDKELRASVTAVGPVHPLNPTYNTRTKPLPNILKFEGLPLFHENDFHSLNNLNLQLLHDHDVVAKWRQSGENSQ